MWNVWQTQCLCGKIYPLHHPPRSRNVLAAVVRRKSLISRFSYTEARLMGPRLMGQPVLFLSIPNWNLLCYKAKTTRLSFGGQTGGPINRATLYI